MTTFNTTIKEISSLVERNGLMYEPNQDKPFTGKYVTYYENGQKKQEGNYKEGKKDGLWTSWDKNGNIIKTATYSNGELVEQ